MYKLLKDKNNEFQCEIKLEGASTKNAKVRLFLEGDGCEYVFSGKIEDGQCNIPLGKLKKFANLLESGKIRLEVVADDTLFTPYESEYELQVEKKVTVEVKQPTTSPAQALVEVKVPEPSSVVKEKIKPQPKQVKESKGSINKILTYLTFNTDFDGTPQSFYKLIKEQRHKDYFNSICKADKLDKTTILKQLLK